MGTLSRKKLTVLGRIRRWLKLKLRCLKAKLRTTVEGPYVTIDDPADGAVIDFVDSQYIASGELDATVETLTYSIDSGPNVDIPPDQWDLPGNGGNGIWNTSLDNNNCPVGPHSISVTAIDGKGNSTTPTPNAFTRNS